MGEEFEMDPTHVRPSEEGEIEQLARIWYDGWQDAHAQIVPLELKQHRTLESFRERLRANLSKVRTVVQSPLHSDFAW